MYHLKNLHKYFYTCLLHVVKVSSHLKKQEKSFFISNFYDPEISSPAKNGLSLTAPYSEVSSAICNIFYQSYSNILGTCSKKSLNENDGLDFTVILKKALLITVFTRVLYAPVYNTHPHFTCSFWPKKVRIMQGQIR